MYRLYFGLKEKPFQLNSDPRFLWPGPRQLSALNTLCYGAEESKGLLLMTGEVGTGKTTLISALTEKIADRVIVARLPDPGLTRREFFHFVADGFGIKPRIKTKERFTEYLGGFLQEVAAGGRKALLIIDEGQIMTPQILREVRLLSNLEIRNRKLLNILLVGQNELLQKLHRPENDAVRKRISIRCTLEPLLRDETEAYIRHRLTTAGCSRSLFTPAAFDEIFQFTGGYPRQINILCDMALLFGYEAGIETIDRSVVVECQERVRIPDRVPSAAVAERLPAPLAGPAQAPVPEGGATGYRPAALGFFLVLVLAPCLLLLFGSSQTSQILEQGRFMKTLMSAPYFLPQPAPGGLPSGQTAGRENHGRRAAANPETGQPASSPVSVPDPAEPSLSPPSVVIIPHERSTPAAEVHPPSATFGPSAISSAPPEADATKKTPVDTASSTPAPMDRQAQTVSIPPRLPEVIPLQPPSGAEPSWTQPPAVSSDNDDRDPAAIFDWLLENKRSLPPAYPARQ